jgi:hypothetical protein
MKSQGISHNTRFGFDMAGVKHSRLLRSFFITNHLLHVKEPLTETNYGFHRKPSNCYVAYK